MAENEEKVFEFYLHVPANVRTRMIDKMQPDDRCRLTRCSKLCSKEAKSSKNYIYGLSITCMPSLASINVVYGYSETGRQQGFMLIFTNRETRNGKIYSSLVDSQTLWETGLDVSTSSSEQYAIEEFETILRTYHKTIKKLQLGKTSHRRNTSFLENIDSVIEGFDNLRELNITGDFDVQKILSKLRKPLKTLAISGVRNCKSFANCEELYQVQNYLSWRDLKLNNAQFLQLSAKSVRMKIGKLTEFDIFQLIRSWQNGTVGKDIGVFRWDLTGSNFNRLKLLRLLRVADVTARIEIKHFNEAGKTALLHQTSISLIFSPFQNAGLT